MKNILALQFFYAVLLNRMSHLRLALGSSILYSSYQKVTGME